MRLTRTTTTTRRRRGFTLVELLVAAALTVMTMAILATAFSTGMSTLSHLKSTVGLSEKLRSSEALLRRDLQAAHLEDGDGGPMRLSQLPRGWNGSTDRGYFEVVQGSAPVPALIATSTTPYVVEGAQDNVPSYRATDHAVFFTTKLAADSAQTVFIGEVPPGAQMTAGTPDPLTLSITDLSPVPASVYAGAWAEIGLFLVPTNRFTQADDGTSKLQLYSLVRRQRVLGSEPLGVAVTANTNTATVAMRDAYPEASISTHVDGVTPAPGNQPYALMNSPGSLVNRLNRLGYRWDGNPTPTPQAYTINNANPDLRFERLKTTGSKEGTDILLNDVISMQVRVMRDNGQYIDNLSTLLSPTAAGDFRLDSTSGARVRAIQIKVRVYDTANRLTRQATITADL